MTVLHFPGAIDITGHRRVPIPPSDIEGTIAELVTPRRQRMMTPAERIMVADPEWIARHRAWLATPEGEEFRAWRSRPWPVIAQEIGDEALAEALGRHPGANRRFDIIIDDSDAEDTP